MRVLVVGMADSVHLGRWLEHFERSEHSFLLFPSSPHRKVHPKIQGLVARNPLKFQIPSLMRTLALPLWLLDRIFGNWTRGLLLASYASRFSPDLVHVLEFQNGGYTFLKAMRVNKTLSTFPLLLTPYGSDMYWFMRFKKHEKRLRLLLEGANAISCECKRDEGLATSLGFRGRFLERVPAFGNISRPLEVGSDESRNIIMVKGYQNKWGQAKHAIRAIKIASDSVRNYEIHFFSCNLSTIWRAWFLAFRYKLTVRTHPKGALSHEQVQQLFARAVVYIGLSRSDGISASMIEAMANGAVPIQSNTSCCDEWLTNGVGGYLVDYDDWTGVANYLVSTLSSPVFRAEARKQNYSDLLLKLNPSSTQQAVLETYDGLLR